MNYIDGKEFLSLKEEEVYKMVPPVGLAKKIIRMLPTKSSVSLTSQIVVLSGSICYSS